MTPLRRAAELHAYGVAASNDMRPALGARRLRAALRALDGCALDGAAELRGRILVSLGYAVAEQGDTDLGLRHLAEAEPLLPPPQRGVLHGQRAVLLRRTGRDDEALTEYDHALRVLDELGEPRELARVLLNRGVLHLRSYRPAPARADLSEAERVADRHGFALIAAKARHNLALLDLNAGDLPRALGAFTALAGVYARQAPGVLPLLGLDRARALLAAGLFRDADDELAAAHHGLAAQRMGQDEGEALLARAEAALLAGRPADARRWARQARSRFTRRRNHRWADLADLVALRAAYPGRAPLPRQALDLADRLRRHGLDEDARVAGLLATRALVRSGRLDDAGRSLDRHGTLRRGDRLDTRILCRLTRAEVADATGQPHVAARQRADGLAELHRHRARLGCLDLQSGAAVHGRDLAHAGLRQALRSGSVPAVFLWSERSRAQALLLPPVRPPADRETAAVLQELRQVRLALRAAERAGQAAATLRARAAGLERRIRHESWSAAGSGPGGPPVRAAAVRAALAGAAMVVYLRDGPTLRALVLHERATRVVTVGSFAAAEEAAARLRADLDATAGRALPDRLAAAVRDAVRRDARTLAAAALDPVLPVVGDRDLVVVPTGGLLGIPWSVLPGCGGRPVTVAASATSWHSARQRRLATPDGHPTAPGGRSDARPPAPGTGRSVVPSAERPLVAGPVALIAGPGNDRGDAEIISVASGYPDATVLTGARASVAATVAALDGAALAHVAAHGSHQAENALFSSLELADGPLMGYDLQRLAAPPRLAVLSTCDLGLSDVRPGDESIGMSTALIAAGTATVIASVGRVADDAAMRVMTLFHRELALGGGPAAALAAATAAVGDATGFVCFGAG